MPQFDSITSYSHTSGNEYNPQSPQIRNKKKGEFAEDILIELENGNVEEALKKLEAKKGKKKNSNQGFIKLLARMGKLMRLVFSFPLKKGKNFRKSKPQASDQSTKSKAKKNLIGKLPAYMKRLSRPMILPFSLSMRAVEKLIQTFQKNAQKVSAWARSIAGQVVMPVIYTARVIQKGLEMVARPISHAAEKIEEGARKTYRFLQEKTEPLRKWINKRIDQFVEKSEWVKKVFGERAESVAHMIQSTLEIVTYALVPLIVVGERISKIAKKARKGISKRVARIRASADRTKKWVGEKTRKIFDLFKKPLQAVSLSFLRVYDSILMRIQKWVMCLLRIIFHFIRFFTYHLPRAVQSIVASFRRNG